MTTTIIVAVSLIALLALALIGAYKWLKHLAANDKLLACFVPTNEAVAINRGGTFHRFLFDPTGGTHLNDPHSWQYLDRFRPWERIPNRYPIDNSLAGKMHPLFAHKDERNWFTRLTGIYFFLPFIEEVDRYPFDWTTYIKTEIDAAGKKTHLTNPHTNSDGSVRMVRSIYAKTVQYYGQVMVLTQDGIDVLVNFTFDVDLTNPFVARFARGNFLGQVKSRLEAELRNYIGGETFSKLFSETDSGSTATGTTPTAGGRGRFYENNVKRLNDHTEEDPTASGTMIGPGIEELYGVSIKAFHILDIQDPTGQSAQQVEARQRLEIARKNLEISAVNVDEERNKGIAAAAKQREINTVDIQRARELMAIETGGAAATKITVARTLFAGAKVVSVGGNGLNTIVNLGDLDGPTTPTSTTTAPAASTPPAARPAPTATPATPARAGRTGP